jgi:hypothetical protein
MTSEPIPIACDLTDAPDTAEERLAEYGRLFAQALTGRERTDQGVRLRFRADEGVDAWVRDLAARELACCPFLDIAVSTTGDEVWWEAGVAANAADEDVARMVVDDLYGLPDSVADGVSGMQRRLTERGLAVGTNASGTVTRIRRQP